MNEYTVQIKRGSIDFTTKRTELESSSESADGIIFKFKGGIIVTIEDQYMPAEVKQRVCMADIGFKKGNLLFDLNNYASPVSLVA